MKWFERLALWIEKRGGRRDIYRTENGKPKLYLVRFYLFKSKWCELMLHRFYMSDAIEPHDHPWASFGWILKTGYYEHVGPNNEFRNWRKPGAFGCRGTIDFHRVEILPGTEGEVWTLFGTFRRKKDWGFIVDGNYVNWKTHMRNTGTLDEQSEYFQFSNGFFPRKVSG